MTQHRQSTQTRHAPKCSVWGAGERDQAGATTVYPWWWTQGHAAWDDRPQFTFFLCGFSASCTIFLVLAAVLSLKEHISRPVRGIIHHTILILLVLHFSLDQRERARGEYYKDSMSCLQ